MLLIPLMLICCMCTCLSVVPYFVCILLSGWFCVCERVVCVDVVLSSDTSILAPIFTYDSSAYTWEEPCFLTQHRQLCQVVVVIFIAETGFVDTICS